MARVTAVRTMTLRGPRNHEGGGAKRTIPKFIIRIDTDDGHYGLGECDYGGNEYFFGVAEAVQYLASYLVGRDPLCIRPFISEMLYGALPPYPENPGWEAGEPSRPKHAPSLSATATQTGPLVWAMSGVETALCDLAGKLLDIPVYTLLGGKFRDHVHVYLDRSHPDDLTDPDAWKRMAQGVVDLGFDRLKFDVEQIAPEATQDSWNRSISRPQLRHIVERLGFVRTAVGPDVSITLDCHMQYHVTDAVQLADAVAPIGISWLEDPTPITNPDALAEVRAGSPIPICAGEMLVPEEFRTFIDRHAMDIIHPDILFVGGLHEAQKVGQYAELHYIPMAMHGNGGCLATIAAAHVAAATRNFLTLEYHFIETPWIGAYVRRVDGLPLFEHGGIPLSAVPGLGVELDPAVCDARFHEGERIYEH